MSAGKKSESVCVGLRRIRGCFVAEIKSTMDIIMEKTKGLTISEEEKAEFRRQELSGKVRGLIQKFLDRILDLAKLKAEVDLLSDYPRDTVDKTMIEETIHHIELGGKNEPMFQIFKEIIGVDIVTVLNIETAYTDRLEIEKTVREKLLKGKLREKGVSGSAVIPNLEADPDWKQYLSNENEAFRAKISSHLMTE